MIGDATTKKASTCSRVIVEKAPSKSSTAAIGTLRSCTPSFSPPVSTAFKAGGWEGVVGFQRTPIRLARGTASFNISSSFAARSVSSMVRPVMFPPGRARLGTIPSATGSATSVTTGILSVAAFTSRARSSAEARIRSGLPRTTSRTSSAKCSVRPSPEYRSTTRFFPST